MRSPPRAGPRAARCAARGSDPPDEPRLPRAGASEEACHELDADLGRGRLAHRPKAGGDIGQGERWPARRAIREEVCRRVAEVGVPKVRASQRFGIGTGGRGQRLACWTQPRPSRSPALGSGRPDRKVAAACRSSAGSSRRYAPSRSRFSSFDGLRSRLLRHGRTRRTACRHAASLAACSIWPDGDRRCHARRPALTTPARRPTFSDRVRPLRDGQAARQRTRPELRRRGRWRPAARPEGLEPGRGSGRRRHGGSAVEHVAGIAPRSRSRARSHARRQLVGTTDRR